MKSQLSCLLSLMIPFFLFAQKSTSENALLWKVTGKNLSQPSYLFGTYHFLSNTFTDTLPAVKNAYQSADAVAGELLMDSSLQQPLLQAAMLKGTTLKELLPDTLFTKVSLWFQSEAGLDIMKLNAFNPVMVSTVAMALVQQKYFPNPAGSTQLDTYFQEKAKQDGKKVMGLETVDVEINALFKQMSLQRQTAILNEMFSEDLKITVGKMNELYAVQDLNGLSQLMYASNYKPEEIKVLLTDRNNTWMQKLPALMAQQPTFIAVGAMHLCGREGLVSRLRSDGYTVTPITTGK